MEEMDKEAYINDELTNEERIAFEAEMARNPELEQEVKRLRQLIEDVELQLLRTKIRTVLSDAPEPGSRDTRRGWWLLLAGLFLVILFLYFALSSDRSAVEESTSRPQEPIEQAPIEQQQAPSQELFPEEEAPADPGLEVLEPAQSKPSRAVPLASNEKPSSGGTSSPLVPQLRGERSQDQNWQAMLDEIWYTTYPLPDHLQLGPSLQPASSLLKARDFPKAYARLQILERREGASNDTLRLLKAYCLLEMRQGKEALIYLEGLGNQHPAWQIQLSWYEGLARLLTGDQEAAKELFSRIAADHNHPAQSHAEKAKRILEKY